MSHLMDEDLRCSKNSSVQCRVQDPNSIEVPAFRPTNEWKVRVPTHPQTSHRVAHVHIQGIVPTLSERWLVSSLAETLEPFPIHRVCGTSEHELEWGVPKTSVQCRQEAFAKGGIADISHSVGPLKDVKVHRNPEYGGRRSTIRGRFPEEECFCLAFVPCSMDRSKLRLVTPRRSPRPTEVHYGGSILVRFRGWPVAASVAVAVVQPAVFRGKTGSVRSRNVDVVPNEIALLGDAMGACHPIDVVSVVRWGACPNAQDQEIQRQEHHQHQGTHQQGEGRLMRSG